MKEDLVALYYLLGVVDSLLAIIALIQLIRIMQADSMMSKLNSINSNDTNRRGGFSGKKFFHVVIMISMIVRGTFFLVEPSYIAGKINVGGNVEMIWVEGASLLFCAAYMMLLIYWAEFYHGVAATNWKVSQSLKWPLLILSIFATASFITFCVLAFLLPLAEVNNVSCIYSGILAGTAAVIALGFLYIGAKLFMLIYSKTLSARKNTQITKVMTVGALCTVFFLNP